MTIDLDSSFLTVWFSQHETAYLLRTITDSGPIVFWRQKIGHTCPLPVCTRTLLGMSAKSISSCPLRSWAGAQPSLTLWNTRGGSHWCGNQLQYIFSKSAYFAGLRPCVAKWLIMIYVIGWQMTCRICTCYSFRLNSAPSGSIHGFMKNCKNRRSHLSTSSLLDGDATWRIGSYVMLMIIMSPLYFCLSSTWRNSGAT